MKRKLLIVTLGVAFLVAVTWLGTYFTNIIPSHPSPAVQTAQAGPYTVTLHVNPNPPNTTNPTTLALDIRLSASQQPAANITVQLSSNNAQMGMDNGAPKPTVQTQGIGKYRVQTTFSMSGSWQVHVLITPLGGKPVDAVFEVTAQ